MNAVCKYHIVKPLPRGFHEGNRFSAYEKEYCTHPNSHYLPGTPEGVTCGGDATQCEIPRAGLKNNILRIDFQ